MTNENKNITINDLAGLIQKEFLASGGKINGLTGKIDDLKKEIGEVKKEMREGFIKVHDEISWILGIKI